MHHLTTTVEGTLVRQLILYFFKIKIKFFRQVTFYQLNARKNGKKKKLKSFVLQLGELEYYYHIAFIGVGLNKNER